MSRMSAQPEQSANQSITPLQGPATGWRRFAQWFPFAQSVSLLVLAVSLLTTYQLWRDASQQTEQLMQADFDYLVAESDRRIEQRMLTYEQVLHGVAGLFAAQKNVTRDEFRAYFEAQHQEENKPDKQGHRLCGANSACNEGKIHCRRAQRRFPRIYDHAARRARRLFFDPVLGTLCGNQSSRLRL